MQGEASEGGQAAVAVDTAGPAWPAHVTAPRHELADADRELTRTTLKRETLYRRALGAADALAALVSLALIGGFVDPVAVLAIAPLLALSKIAGLYDRDENLLHKATLDEVPDLTKVACAYTVLVWVFDAQVFGYGLGKAEVLSLWGALLVSLITTRVMARMLVGAASPAERCLVIGSSRAAGEIARKLAANPRINATVVARFPLEGGDRGRHEPPLRYHYVQLRALLHDERVGRAIIAPNTSDSDEMLDVIRLMKSLGVRVSVLPRLFEVIGSSVSFDEVEGMTLLGVPRYGLSKSSWYLKRSLDVVVSSVALIVVAPTLAVIATAIKLESRGPVFFRQTRIGRSGREFQMLKFRSMYDGADAQKQMLRHLNESDGLFKIADDPRITRVGRFLRRTSLDELPQLFNVLGGQMSLVGPRPLVPEEDRLIEGWHRRRQEATPGMTGVWQVLGSRRVPLHEMVVLDYLYRANWSLWLDAKTILRTVAFVLRGRGC